MRDLDVETRGRLEAATRRREQVLAGALNAVAVSRANAAKVSVALQAAMLERATSLSAGARTGPGSNEGDGRPDENETIAGKADGPPLGPSPRRSGWPPAEQDDHEDELEGRDWLR